MSIENEDLVFNYCEWTENIKFDYQLGEGRPPFSLSRAFAIYCNRQFSKMVHDTIPIEKCFTILLTKF